MSVLRQRRSPIPSYWVDNLNSGEDYNDVRPAVQVGILDFTLFPDHPELIAKQDEFIDEACAAVFQLSHEEKIRLQCEAREDYYRRQRTIQNDMDRKLRTIENQNVMIEKQNAVIKDQNKIIKGLEEKTVLLQEEVDSLKKLLSEHLM